MTPEQVGLAELTAEQWQAGRDIAELCGISEDILAMRMSWGGDTATVEYGLAHSARYMEHLTPEEIMKAVFDGIVEYNAMLYSSDGNQ